MKLLKNNNLLFYVDFNNIENLDFFNIDEKLYLMCRNYQHADKILDFLKTFKYVGHIQNEEKFLGIEVIKSVPTFLYTKLTRKNHETMNPLNSGSENLPSEIILKYTISDLLTMKIENHNKCKFVLVDTKKSWFHFRLFKFKSSI